MKAADDPQCYTPSGALLKLSNTAPFTADDAGYDGDAADSDIYSEWINPGSRNIRGAYEVIWTGSPNADIGIEAKLAGPGVPVTLEETPVGPNSSNTYTGSVSAADLESEDIGSCVINLSGQGFQHRLHISNSVGPGTYRARWKSMNV